MEGTIGEIRMFAGTFAPRGWAYCSGQIMPIAQNTALFSILGTTYGGNGQTTFALPDFRSRTPVHIGQGPGLSPIVLGEQGGTETTTLQVSQLPTHSHTIQVNDNLTVMDATGAGHFLNSKTESGESVAATSLAAPVTLNPATMGPVGGNQPFNQRNPFTGIAYIICLEGIFPSRN